jgi:hypothetical protein
MWQGSNIQKKIIQHFQKTKELKCTRTVYRKIEFDSETQKLGAIMQSTGTIDEWLKQSSKTFTKHDENRPKPTKKVHNCPHTTFQILQQMAYLE